MKIDLWRKDAEVTCASELDWCINDQEHDAVQCVEFVTSGVELLIPKEFVTGSCLDTDKEKEYENSKNPIRDTRRQIRSA